VELGNGMRGGGTITGMNAASRHCPVCDSLELKTLGPILHPRPALVAGVELDLGDVEYRLVGCQRCGFQFKDPAIPAATLMECYRQADSANWDDDPDPWQRKFDVLKEALERFSPGRRVLDVGCFNGALLRYLGGGWQKFGVEPSADAAKLAESRDVQIVAPTLEQLNGRVAPFDAVMAIDVAEHVSEPLTFFRQLSTLVAKGGILIILTGDNESLAWRLQRGVYWYCSLPEHVSFYCRRSLDAIGERTGMRGIEYRRMCHKRMPLRRWCSDMTKSAAYIVGRTTGGLGIPRLRRQFVERRGPSVQSANDHMLYVFRKL
jgi:SAM-dependent methyltransferase